MTKRYIIKDNRAIIDTESILNEIPTKIFVTEDPLEAVAICRELNKQDQRIKELEEKPSFLNIVDDYFLKYDGEYFNLHKPADIRCLCYLINRLHGYSELQCEYNDEDRKEIE